MMSETWWAGMFPVTTSIIQARILIVTIVTIAKLDAILGEFVKNCNQGISIPLTTSATYAFAANQDLYLTPLLRSCQKSAICGATIWVDEVIGNENQIGLCNQ